jgi:hypothetical protein
VTNQKEKNSVSNETSQAKMSVARAIKRLQEARLLLSSAAQELEVSYWDEAQSVEANANTLDRVAKDLTDNLGKVMAKELVYEQQ